jgi:hypothetical protein
MELTWAIEQLTHTASGITQLCLAVSDAHARFKPAPDSWSILEVINHLYDEEREDFRQRVDLMLHHPDAEWPPIDPDGWVTSRSYQQRDFRQSVANFASEREQSLAWLGSLHGADWDRSRTAPAGFTLHAGDLLSAWVAHDILHLRQLVELHYQLAKLRSQPYSIEYAGDW